MRLSGLGYMRQFIGRQEQRDKLVIRAFLKKYAINSDIDIDPSQTPWCSAMMNACERAAGNETEGKLNARSWLTYGKEIKDEDAQEGDLVVFERGSNGWSGHITYFLGWDDDNNLVRVLGGNQSDMVCESTYIQDRILGIRRS